MKFTDNKYGSKGVQITNKQIQSQKMSNLKPMSVEELLSKLDIVYDDASNTIILKCDSNLLIQSLNNIFISKEDTVILTGDKQGFDGKLYQNPELNNK
jgi:hypothetical protein